MYPGCANVNVTSFAGSAHGVPGWHMGVSGPIVTRPLNPLGGDVAATDATASALAVRVGHLAVVQRLVQDIVRNTLLPRDVAQRATAGRSLLDDLARLVVADVGIERGRRRQRQLGVALALLAVRLDAGHTLLVE